VERRKNMHVAVFADIEGSFGIWRMRQCRMGTPEWQYGRMCLTEDVNAVIQGAFDGGADRVTVKDNHEVGFNILLDKLDRRVSYVGGHHTRPTFFGDVSGYDLILFVAIHAASGTPDAFFPHTHYGIFSEVKINGKPVCEVELYGSYLGELGRSIGFFSGEDIAVEQASRSLPWAKSVVVDKSRQAYTSGDASINYLRTGRESLHNTASQAVRNANSMQPFIIDGPVHFEVIFRNEKLADKFNTWKFTQNSTLVEWDADNMVDGFDKFNKLTFFPKKIYPFRRQFLFLMRNFYRVKNTYFAPAPNPEGAVML
jgi:D-amino peptidase